MDSASAPETGWNKSEKSIKDLTDFRNYLIFLEISPDEFDPAVDVIAYTAWADYSFIVVKCGYSSDWKTVSFMTIREGY